MDVDAHSGFLQVMVLAFTAVLTAVYVVVTHRLVHLPHGAYVRPRSGQTQGLTSARGSHWVLNVVNLGPGLAQQVKVEVLGAFAGADIRIHNWLAPAEGPSELRVGAEVTYRCGLLGFPFELKPAASPLRISWRTQTGKKQLSRWLFLCHEKDKFRPLGRWEWRKWRVAVWLANKKGKIPHGLARKVAGRLKLRTRWETLEQKGIVRL